MALQLKPFGSDESAVAYGLFVIAFFLVAGTIMWILVVESAQQTNVVMNDLIGQGVVSQKTRDVYVNQMTLINYSPVFMLLGVFAWGIIRALEKKRSEG